jgi:hypothetical protein
MLVLAIVATAAAFGWWFVVSIASADRPTRLAEVGSVALVFGIAAAFWLAWLL